MELLSGFFFWLVVLFVAAVIIYEVVQDSGAGATAATVLGTAGIWYFSGAHNPLPWISTNWELLVACFLTYAVFGTVWVVIEWWLLIHDKADQYEANRTELQANWRGKSAADQSSYGSYKAWVQTRGYPPSWGEHKSDFLMWFTWWPFALLWFLTGRMLKFVGNYVYRTLSGWMVRMSNAIFAGRFTELK